MEEWGKQDARINPWLPIFDFQESLDLGEVVSDRNSLNHRRPRAVNRVSEHLLCNVFFPMWDLLIFKNLLWNLSKEQKNPLPIHLDFLDFSFCLLGFFFKWWKMWRSVHCKLWNISERMKDDLNKRRDPLYFWVRRLNIVKILFFPSGSID